ncbi:MAG: BCCT family transporter [Pseudomonadota bacterium]
MDRAAIEDFFGRTARFTKLRIRTADSGFYKGYSIPIAVISKTIMSLLVIWALAFPLNANNALGLVNAALLQYFNAFYVAVAGGFLLFLLVLAFLPSTGRRKLGRPEDTPEFSNISWFSMMFGAGLGVGLMVYATAEPLGLWGANPVLLATDVEPNTQEAVRSAMRYTFLHYGFNAWAIYVVSGLCLAYYAYTRGMPLTVRSALTPILGKAANGAIGHVVDILGVVATILGVSVTIGFGVSQLVEGIYSVTDMAWLVQGSAGEQEGPPRPSTVGLISALLLIMTLSVLSAVSGVGRGIKHLSNLNLALSSLLLLVFVVFGSFAFALSEYASSLADYVANLLPLSFESFAPLSQADLETALPAPVAALAADDLAAVYAASTNAYGSLADFKEGLPAAFTALDGADQLAVATYEAARQGRLFNWQSGWTTFYWAWWIAFSPFVGLFLARISRGRTVREFIIACVFVPALVCFAWMTILGSTAIDLELSGLAQGAIINATTTNKLFAALNHMLSGDFLYAVTAMCVLLILTFLVTSADSGILVMNTIMSGGSIDTDIKHRIVWGVILTLVIGALIVAGSSGAQSNPFDALRNAMIIGALPFALVMVLMCISLVIAVIADDRAARAQEMATAA